MTDFWNRKWTENVTIEHKDKKDALKAKTNEEVVQRLELVVTLLEKSSAKEDKYVKKAREIVLDLMGVK